MKDTALYFLYRVASKIPRNQFAKAIYYRFRDAGDYVNVDSLGALLAIPYGSEPSLEETNPVNPERYKDYRFRYLYLRAFRKFPLNEAYYGISFCNPMKKNVIAPESTLLQGGNGTGKTSVFGAMEYLFTKRVSAAEKQGFQNKAGIDDYIIHAGGSKENVDINVVTSSLTFSLNSNDQKLNELSRLCLLPFFCSEFDVDKVISEGINDFIYEQMGYSLTRDIIQKVDKELKNAEDQYGEREESLENIQNRIADLDREIGMYDKLWTSFLSLLLKMRDGKIIRNLAENLKVLLSKEFVSQLESADDRLKGKELSLDELEKEEEAIKNALGGKYGLRQVKQHYLQVKTLLVPESEQLDSLLKPSVSRKDSMAEALKNLNCVRKCIYTMLVKLLDINGLSDMATTVEWYDDLLKGLKKERQEAQDKRVIYEEVDAIISQKEVYTDFLNALKKEAYGKIDTLTTVSRELVNEVMDLFLLDGEEMNMTFDNNSGEFKMNISLKTEKRTIPFSPEKYLNTFRYKLFCMTMKMSIAFAMQKFYQINFPIVIDDVFYSSDFIHRGKVRDFFGLLFDKHKKLFSGDVLQVIFFTHDDVVIDAAYRGITDVVGCNGVNRQIMFDFREADGPEEIELSHITQHSQVEPVKIKMVKIAYS